MTAATPPPLPHHAVQEKYLAGTGPGGQNVNKVATACQLRVNIYALGLAPDVYARLKTLAGARLTSGGELVVTARRYRTQEANRADAHGRVQAMLAAAHERPERRVKTRPSRAAKARRVDRKKARGSIKAGRGRVTPID